MAEHERISEELFADLRHRLSAPAGTVEAVNLLNALITDPGTPQLLKERAPLALADIDEGRSAPAALASFRRDVGLDQKNSRWRRVDWASLAETLSDYASSEAAKHYSEAKYWFEIAEWLALLAVFTYASHLPKGGSYAGYFLSSIVVSMRFAVVYFLTYRLFMYFDRPLSWCFRRLREWGLVDKRRTATILRLALTAAVGVGCYLFIDRALTEVVSVLPRTG